MSTIVTDYNIDWSKAELKIKVPCYCREWIKNDKDYEDDGRGWGVCDSCHGKGSLKQTLTLSDLKKILDNLK